MRQFPRGLAVFLLLVAACASEGDPGPSAVEQIEAACALWAEVGCRKNDECLGLDEPLEQCVEDETWACLRDADENGQACYVSMAEALNRCSPNLYEQSCDDYCSTTDSGFTFCYYPCSFFCPAE